MKMAPGRKADLTAALAEALDVSPQALSVPDIDSYTGLMHTLFTLEDLYGLKVRELDGEICLTVDVRQNKDAARLHEMLCSWQRAGLKPIQGARPAPLPRLRCDPAEHGPSQVSQRRATRTRKMKIYGQV